MVNTYLAVQIMLFLLSITHHAIIWLFALLIWYLFIFYDSWNVKTQTLTDTKLHHHLFCTFESLYVKIFICLQNTEFQTDFYDVGATIARKIHAIEYSTGNKGNSYAKMNACISHLSRHPMIYRPEFDKGCKSTSHALRDLCERLKWLAEVY